MAPTRNQPPVNTTPAASEAQANEISELRLKLEAAEETIAGYQQENGELKEKNAGLEELANKLVADTKAEIDELKEALAAATEENGNLKSQVASMVQPAEKTKVPSQVTFEHGDKKWKVKVAKANIPGIGSLTALEIANSNDAKEWLVSKQSGLIEEVA